MGTVDLIMAGQLGDAAIGALGLGNSVFYTFAIMGTGLLLGLDTFVSQAYGAGNLRDCRHSLTQGVWLAGLIGLPLTALFWLMRPVYALFGVTPQVSFLASSYLAVLSFSMLPLAWYSAFRRYLQGLGRVRPVMFALISANLVNWFFNWVLIPGHLGFPALGVRGSALSTVIARIYMAGLLGAVVWWVDRTEMKAITHVSHAIDWSRIRSLLRIGMPAAGQIMLEIGAFGAVGMMAGRLNATALAAHQIALNCAAVTFMVPLGIASAAAVSVGHALGRGDQAAARRAGFISLGLALTFMSAAGITFLAIPKPLLGIYTREQNTIAAGATLLAIGAAFQLFDGAQVVLTGALRGAGDTRTPMLVNLVGYWMLGLPIGYVLCFPLRFGVTGLWWGLTLSLVLVSMTLLIKWSRFSAVVVAAAVRS
jgi:MATE family multidrug resistance protein